MIVLGVLCLLVGYIFKFPHHVIVADVGWILLILGAVLFVLGQVGHPVAGRRRWY